MNQKIKKTIQYIISIAIMIAAFYWAVNGIDIEDVYNKLQSANYIWAIAPIPIVILSHWLRAMRWKTMLKPIFEPKSTFNLFSAVMIGYALNNLIARSGEFLRPYVVAKREKVSYTSLFATIIMERIIDVFTLLGLFAVLFFVFSDRIIKILPAELDQKNIAVIAGLVLIALISSFYKPFVDKMLEWIIKPFSERIYIKISDLFAKFRTGFAIIKRPSQYLRLIIETSLIWFCYALPMYIMFYCFDFVNVYGLGLEDALILLIGSGIAISLAPTPGGFGVYHGIIAGTLEALYGVPRDVGLAYATINHGINFILQLLVGLIFLYREKITKLPDKEVMDSEIGTAK